jgi:hypothetical protein
MINCTPTDANVDNRVDDISGMWACSPIAGSLLLVDIKCRRWIMFESLRFENLETPIVGYLLFDAVLAPFISRVYRNRVHMPSYP